MPVPTYYHPQYLSVCSIPRTCVEIHHSLPCPLHGRHAAAGGLYGRHAAAGGLRGRHAAAASLRRRPPTQRRG